MSNLVGRTRVSLNWYGWVGSAQVSRSWCDQVECCPWLYVAPRSQCPISQEQVSHHLTHDRRIPPLLQ